MSLYWLTISHRHDNSADRPYPSRYDYGWFEGKKVRKR